MTLAGHNDASGGLFALCWGLFATVMGGLLVTDFRGFTRWFVRTAEARGPWRRQSRPSQQAGRLVLVRVIGGIFAVVGPVMLVVGVVLTAHGRLRPLPP
ncbi:hypothetical protein [Kitasatospora sp. NPDC047058]|uniref:hypothetical protein n=1 Tax=Kitasatospora sp. NPDC047058 TaxID=3155620 RepID=UPI0033F9C826